MALGRTVSIWQFLTCLSYTHASLPFFAFKVAGFGVIGLQPGAQLGAAFDPDPLEFPHEGSSSHSFEFALVMARVMGALPPSS